MIFRNGNRRLLWRIGNIWGGRWKCESDTMARILFNHFDFLFEHLCARQYFRQNHDCKIHPMQRTKKASKQTNFVWSGLCLSSFLKFISSDKKSSISGCTASDQHWILLHDPDIFDRSHSNQTTFDLWMSNILLSGRCAQYHYDCWRIHDGSV